ncbi:hypothetical protein IFM89_009327 [Coptis chinensis]|uniref:Uncharacterized protein n=1 Tax=Coptis chinensis TaxID=261450 RepID=A0A835LPU2_9MAGN|nr:hypothetical protein IFM89_009327 [Coptis chinensis]
MDELRKLAFSAKILLAGILCKQMGGLEIRLLCIVCELSKATNSFKPAKDVRRNINSSIHRLLSEGDPVFQQVILYATRKGTREQLSQLFQIWMGNQEPETPEITYVLSTVIESNEHNANPSKKQKTNSEIAVLVDKSSAGKKTNRRPVLGTVRVTTLCN